MFALRGDQLADAINLSSDRKQIVVFGASGTAGNGILKAALESDDIESIQVITRRSTARIAAGVASGKIEVTQHMDYLDYSSLANQIADADVVYWAIGISSIGVDEATYRKIHIDFPAEFLKTWLSVSSKNEISFHFISSSDLSEDSTAMWVRAKVLAEKTLFALAKNTKLDVIAYRPDYIGPTEDEAHFGQKLLYGFFAPVGAAVKATQIGNAMIEVARRGELANGETLSTREIHAYSDAYEQRTAQNNNIDGEEIKSRP
ncbi:MAG: NAD(P)H-binding protein [Acidiferrobacterales bacterium]|nr:NAD(P)H-binding protein [Acidiferrobacterales bacterium]